MFGSKRKPCSFESMVCSLCEFSREKNEKFYCGKKEVSPASCCGRFIFDPLKKKVNRISVREKTKDIDFLPLD